MSGRVFLLAIAGIHVDEFCPDDNKSRVVDHDIQQLEYGSIPAEVKLIEPIDIGDNVIVAKSLVAGVSANIMRVS